MCDISDEQSLNSVPGLVGEIQERANISDCVIMVLANKCELDIDQSVVLNLETKLQQKGPNIHYWEISVQLNIEIQSAMKQLADALEERREKFIQQRLLAHFNRNSFVIDKAGVASASNLSSLPQSFNEKSEPSVTIGDRKVIFREMITSQDGLRSSEKDPFRPNEHKKRKSRCCK